jgi:preprotein translocase subunit SecY
MTSERQQAIAEFRRIMVWIAAIAVLMVAGALIYLYFTSSLDVNTIIATTLGVFFSVLLGCGLFAAAFFSSKSGYDENVTNVTRSERDKK